MIPALFLASRSRYQEAQVYMTRNIARRRRSRYRG